MMQDFNHCESVYWVFTQVCNDHCDHCYNSSGPQGDKLTDEECLAIIDNLPDKMERLILSGGEPLAKRKQLYMILDRLKEKYGDEMQIMLQTNGDLLDGEKLDTLIEKGITRFDIASIDRYHKKAGARQEELTELFKSRGLSDDNQKPLIEKETYLKKETPSFGFWGASEDMWLGGNWARGRAMQNDIWMEDHTHNFCEILSGAKGFLGGSELPQEISIQLWRINPCCPGTAKAMGDARKEKVADVLKRVSESPIFQKLNEGKPYQMGESIGISQEKAFERGADLKNICLWCDEFFTKHFDIETMSEMNEETLSKSIDTNADLSDFEKVLKAQSRSQTKR